MPMRFWEEIQKMLWEKLDWKQMKAKNVGMLFWGDVGTGKTYLAACVANALIEQEVSVRMLNFSHILNSGFETRNELLEDICRCSLLRMQDTTVGNQ